MGTTGIFKALALRNCLADTCGYWTETVVRALFCVCCCLSSDIATSVTRYLQWSRAVGYWDFKSSKDTYRAAVAAMSAYTWVRKALDVARLPRVKLNNIQDLPGAKKKVTALHIDRLT